MPGTCTIVKKKQNIMPSNLQHYRGQAMVISATPQIEKGALSTFPHYASLQYGQQLFAIKTLGSFREK